jgi:hypothetical protein
VAAHHLGDRGAIRQAAGGRGDDLSDLAEVGRSEDAGSRDREKRRVLLAVVDEAVD